jgi:hypothetical protein
MEGGKISEEFEVQAETTLTTEQQNSEAQSALRENIARKGQNSVTIFLHF